MRFAYRPILLLGMCLLFASLPAAAQTGSISFVVRITPSAGVAEPVRGLPFYLLRKSFADIQREAEATVPKLDFDGFVDHLTVSDELKAWMKKNHSVKITGEDFRKSLTADDIINIPEFWKAYFDENTSGPNIGFPPRKYKESDRTKNPEKYEREIADYHVRIRKYLGVNPDSKDVMDAGLESIDSGPRWADIEASHAKDVKTLALDLAQSRYTVGQVQTDVDGRGEFSGIAPGTYWITCLNIRAQVGDTREKWDVAVSVQAGATTRITLSNFNAVRAAGSAR
ncbi:MAG TPA: carboxypeptidase-like regulatory domain-containing protein [Candidatus Acidoferrales bacterium]|nr:carboxypeptidase-like regulatory domain-containing protein [Candidatus Acidoferrales bacterium]